MSTASSDTPEQLLERYLHEQIPLSAAMGVRVGMASLEQVRLWAPLSPNVNHNETVFGGSAAALAILSAWALLHLRIERASLRARLVIQRSSVEYERPIAGEFEALCGFSDPLAWERFRITLVRRGRARLRLTADVVYHGQRMASFEGEFVALRQM
ncbi:MAG TPA: YiiD C-terminal domain-containing protein [Steroidobacteraceae bacterium]|nr:YiiD C-terminal domain-containing protein [Steroidobacteraceae bacterium]